MLIYSDNVRDYERYINNIFNKLIKAGLSVNINKYEFYIIYTKYLSLIIILSGIEIDLEKIIVITE